MDDAGTLIDLSHFHADGYQIVGGILPENRISGIRSLLESEMDEVLLRLSRHGINGSLGDIVAAIDRCVSETPAAEMEFEFSTLLSGHFPLQVRLSEVLWSVPLSDQVQELARAALRSRRIYLHMPSVARFVFPRNSHAAVPAHQDISYNEHMSDFITMWVPLVPIDDDCGGVAVYEQTKDTEIMLRDAVRELWLPAIETQGLKRVRCSPMNPGDVLIFGPRLIHESVANVSNRVRLSVEYRFFGEGTASTKHFLDLQTGRVVDPRPGA